MQKSMALLFLLAMSVFPWVPGPVAGDDMVSFQPVRAPFKGPENAPVTIIEIADFM
jgi:hypothetical protein